MTKDRLSAVLLLAVLAAALGLRLPRLDLRPMHGDEAVHAVKFSELLTEGTYYYDPQEYHGPTLYYFTLPLAWAFGAETLADTSEVMFRLVPVAFGMGFIALLWLLRMELGRGGILCAAALAACSPALVFYSRYYIQETLLVFFTFLVIVAGWRYSRTLRWRWALLTGLGLGLMTATKETCIITFGALAAAVVLVVARRDRGPEVHRRWDQALFSGAGAAGVLVALAVAALFYSGFGSNLGGVLDMYRALPTYFERAGGGGLHDHPWYYYVKMLLFTQYVPGPWWSEGLIVGLAAVGGGAALWGRGVERAGLPLVRVILVYTFLSLVAYCCIPYKTPWCMLGFLHGMTVLGGVGAWALIRSARGVVAKVMVGGLLTVLTLQLGWQAYRGSFRFYADPRNPCVYAHPVNDVVRLGERVEELADLHADGRWMIVKIISPDYWPLPWYLRRLERVGYWDEVPSEPEAPVMIVAPDLAEEVEAALEGDYRCDYYGLRPDVALLLYVEEGLWRAFIETRTGKPAAEFTGE